MPDAICAAGYDLLRKWEQGPKGGPALKPYVCPAGRGTIAYGHVIGPSERFDTITPAQADELLHRDVASVAAAVRKAVRVPLSDNEFAALVCFAFNVGVVAFGTSTLLKRINAGAIDEVPDELRRWNKITDPVSKQKVPCEGLTNRREAEIALWSA